MLTPSNIATDRDVFWRLLAYIKPIWWVFALAIVANICYSMVDAALVRLMEPLLDEGFGAQNPDIIGHAPWLVLALFFGRGIFSFTSNYGMEWVGRKVVLTLREALFKHYLQLPLDFFAKKPSGELIAKITFNAEQVANACTKAITTLFRDGALVLFLLINMLWVSWRLTLIYLLIGPFIGAVAIYVSKRFRRISKKIQDAMADVTQVSAEGVEGIEVIKACGGEAHEQRRFQQVANSSFKAQLKLSATKYLSVPIIQFLAACALAAIIYLSASGTIQTLSPGQFVVLMSSMVAMLKPLKQLSTVQSMIQGGLAGAQSIFEILDLPVESKGYTDLSADTSIAVCKGEISYQGVSFRYASTKEEDCVLQNISFQAKAGQKIAVVGPSGSGKSTLLSLLPRFYLAQRGKITLDGVDIGQMHLPTLRRSIAIVSQQVFLFNDTVANNIAYGQTQGAKRDKIAWAARTANAWAFISALPQGLDTLVGERGNALSGGQRQRIAIARALLRDAPILILDEATAALDTQTEQQLQQALGHLMQNRTTFIIAHRLSTIEQADLILVLDQGRIIETGSHSSLLAQGGLYHKLYRMQFKGQS